MSEKKTVESFVPYYDNILIKKEGGEKESKGGIILVDDENSKSYAEGIVLKVGDGYKLQNGDLRPLNVNVGDKVIFRKMTEISIDLNGVQHFVISEGNVIGIKTTEDV